MNGQAPAPRRLRIAVLNRHFGYRFGGAERYAAAIVEELAARHDVHVFAQEIEHDFPGVTYHHISRPMAKPRWVNQLWFALQTWWQTRKGFDVVHSHENTWHGDVQTVHVRPFKVGLFHNKHGIKRVLKWLALLTSPRLLTYWCLEAARFRNARIVVATSTQVMNETVQAYPGTAACMHVITPGVKLPDKPGDASEARRGLGLPLNVPMALFVGNDYAKKGLGTLLEALPQVHGLHLAVVGHGQRVADFKRKARQLQVAERVHFLGSLPDVTPAYEAADLLVHPTTEDTFAMVVLEAMAHGLPVIVSGSEFCGIANEMTPNINGIIIKDPLSHNEISKLISNTLASKNLILTLKNEGYAFAKMKSWANTAESHNYLYTN